MLLLEADALYAKLTAYMEKEVYPFHMPGHKRRSCFSNMTELSQIQRLDITEIDGFDDLHHPEGILLEMQKKAAALFQAEETFLQVNGSTGAILAAISAVCPRKGNILVARNCHKSVYHAIEINDLKPSYVWPKACGECGLQGQISLNDVEEALKKDETIQAIVITSPTYEGICSNVRAIAQLAHEKGIPLIVDEAHGAHFVFSESFPESALCQGADIVIHSVHKTLPALTQCALLHVQNDLVDRERLLHMTDVYQTSSPSYILMSSIMASLYYMEKEGDSAISHMLSLRKKIESSARNWKRFSLVEEAGADPGKIIISSAKTNFSGNDLYRYLLDEHKLQMEMAGAKHVVGILTGLDTEEGVNRLIQAMEEIDARAEKEQFVWPGRPEQPECVLTIAEALSAPKRWAALSTLEGMVMHDYVYIYPPGIPILTPGEMCGRSQAELIMQAKQQGLPLRGVVEGAKAAWGCYVIGE